MKDQTKAMAVVMERWGQIGEYLGEFYGLSVGYGRVKGGGVKHESQVSSKSNWMGGGGIY